jgi:hypothetical protein
MSQDTHYNHPVPHHDPSEGFDPTEPHSQRITFFVVVSVITLGVVLFALQNYFMSTWNSTVQEKVFGVATPDLASQRALEEWRMTHYEFTTPEQKEVRLPIERAKQLVLDEAKQGKTFYPAKSTTPVPEEPAKK